MKRKLKTLIFLIAMVIGTLSVSGCSSPLTDYIISTYPQAVRDREQANIDIATKLRSKGLISELTYNNIVSNIEQATKDILTGISEKTTADGSSAASATASNFAKVVSNVKLYMPDYVDILEEQDDGTYKSVKTYTKGTDYHKSIEEADGDSCNFPEANSKYNFYYLSDSDANDYVTMSSFLLGNYIYGDQQGHHQKWYTTQKGVDNGNYNNTTEHWCKKCGTGNWHKSNEWLETDTVDTIDFFSSCSESLTEELNSMLDLNIYVLNPTSILNSGKSIDEVLEDIYEARQSENEDAIESLISKYFIDTGKSLTGEMLSVADGEDSTRDSSSLCIIGDSTFNENGGGPGNDLIITQSIWTGTHTDATMTDLEVAAVRFHEFNEEVINEILDLVEANDGTYYFGASGAYLLEYPVSIIDTFESDANDPTTIYGNLTTDSGIGINIGTGSIVYYTKNNDGTYSRTGKTIENGDGYLTTSFTTSDTEGKSSFALGGMTKYKLRFSNGQTYTTYIPQIVLRDYLEATWSPGVIDDETLVVYGRKIRFQTGSTFWANDEYLDTINNKDIYSYKLKYSTSGSDYCAYFVDVDGNTVSTSSYLYIYDICDITSLVDTTPTTITYARYNSSASNKTNIANTVVRVKYMSDFTGSQMANQELWLKSVLPDDWVTTLKNNTGGWRLNDGETISDYGYWNTIIYYLEAWMNGKHASTSDAVTGAEAGSGSASGWAKYSVTHFPEAAMTAQETVKECTAENSDTQPKQDTLRECTKVNKINATLKFPGEYIGKIDIDNDASTIEQFYCVATTKGLFDSNLFSSWINSSTSKESLVWWNSYLAEKSYKYTIDMDGLEDYLETTYSYELSQTGAIILDLTTVAKIQEIFDKDSDEERASKLKTLFIVIGILLIAYSMAIMLCWIVDTHIDLGFSVLNKATFGHWIAVTSEDDIPSYRTGEHTYVTGSKMFIRCLIIIAVAIVLIRVNILQIVSMLITTFGKIGGYIEGVMRGR
jgi:hypothetical protein